MGDSALKSRRGDFNQDFPSNFLSVEEVNFMTKRLASFASGQAQGATTGHELLRT